MFYQFLQADPSGGGIASFFTANHDRTGHVSILFPSSDKKTKRRKENSEMRLKKEIE